MTPSSGGSCGIPEKFPQAGDRPAGRPRNPVVRIDNAACL
jgi:hypothetical protein